MILNANGAEHGTQVLDFNTIVNHRTTSGAAAVDCDTDIPMTASNNIVYGGTGGDGQISGNCAWKYSNIEGGEPGTGNIDEPPEFVGASEGDYHLLPESPGVNAADPESSLEIDYDGDSRPQGGRHDMGADEVVDG